MEGRILMSTKELQRIAVVERVARGEMTMKSASEMIVMSPRQCRRLVRRFESLGAAGLAHKLCGRPSNRQADAPTRTAAIAAYKELYTGFGPTLASEHMAVRQGLSVHPETLRLWLIDANLWQARQQRRRHRKKRERKERFGEMIQFDGSHHLWFEDRGSKCCLMTMVDDATGRFHARFTADEGTIAAMQVTAEWIGQYGIPRSIYADRLKVYVTDREATIEEQLNGQEARTQFGRACHKLGIRIIAAHSPQAKGRVENKHKLTQDRLIKDMRLAGISTIEAGNEFLKTWLPKMNERFSVPPANPDDMHQAVPNGLDLRTVFCHEETRVVRNDWTVQFDNCCLQISRQPDLPPSGSKVTVQRWQDNSLHVVHKGAELTTTLLETRPQRPTPPVEVRAKTEYKPSPTHPWRQRPPEAYDLSSEQITELADRHLGPVRITGYP
jgi:hypothetical protein